MLHHTVASGAAWHGYGDCVQHGTAANEVPTGPNATPLFPQAMLHHTVAPGTACKGDGRPLQGQETTNTYLDAEPFYCEQNGSGLYPSL